MTASVWIALVMTLPLMGAGWEDVQRLRPDSKVKVKTAAGESKGTFVSASEAAIVMRSGGGEQSISRAEIRRVQVADSSRRVRRGLLTTAIGAGAGLGVAFAICPHCASEGAPWKYSGPLLAVGAGIGALGFLPEGYRTVYRSK